MFMPLYSYPEFMVQHKKGMKMLVFFCAKH